MVNVPGVHVPGLLLQSAEELDKERLEAREKVDAQAKQERQENARRNAEALAQQKVSHAS